MKMRGLCIVLLAAFGTSSCRDSTPVSPERLSGNVAASGSALVKDLVPTPDGWYDRDCVHAVPDGAHIGVDGLVTRRDGSSYQTPVCPHPGAFTAWGTPERYPADNGWVEFAKYRSGSTSWGEIHASWHVPAVPDSTYTSNEVYFGFPGIESSDYILQPVLTYGYASDYGGNYWTATGWRCNRGDDCHHGPVISVSPGDSIVGTVSDSACANGRCSWNVVVTDVNEDTTVSYSAEDTIAFTRAVGGALEVYNLPACHFFPADDGIFFTGIALYNQSHSQVTPTWADTVQSGVDPNCTFSVTSTAAVVNLHYNTLVVSLTGPTADTAYKEVTVTASASGGVSPYDYTWTIDGSSACNNSDTCSGELGDQGSYTTFGVTVTDASGYNSYEEHTVYAEWAQCQGCLGPAKPGG
jgi:hypothetical protein